MCRMRNRLLKRQIIFRMLLLRDNETTTQTTEETNTNLTVHMCATSKRKFIPERKSYQVAGSYYYLKLLILSVCILQPVCSRSTQGSPQIINNQHEPQKLKQSTIAQAAIQEVKTLLTESIQESSETSTKFDDDQQDEFYLAGPATKGISNRFIRQSLKDSSRSFRYADNTSAAPQSNRDQLLTASDSSTGKYLSRLGAARYRYRPQVYATLELSSFGPTAENGSDSESSKTSSGKDQVRGLVQGEVADSAAHYLGDSASYTEHNQTVTENLEAPRDINEQQQQSQDQVDPSASGHDLGYSDRNSLELFSSQPQNELSTHYNKQSDDNNNIDQFQAELLSARGWKRQENLPVNRHHHFSTTNRHKNVGLDAGEGDESAADELDDNNEKKNRKTVTENRNDKKHSKLKLSQPAIITKDVSIRSGVILIENMNNSTIDGLERRNLSGSLDAPPLSNREFSSNFINLPANRQAESSSFSKQVIHPPLRTNSKRIPTFASRLFTDLEDAPSSFAIAQPDDSAPTQQVFYQLVPSKNNGNDERSVVEGRAEERKSSTISSKLFAPHTNEHLTVLKSESTFDYDEPVKNQLPSDLTGKMKLSSQKVNDDVPFGERSSLPTYILPPARVRYKNHSSTGLHTSSSNLSNNPFRTSSTSSEIRVLEPNSTRLVINSRGLIMAAKKGSGRPYNVSALFANHVNHSLNPVRITPATAVPSLGESRPSFLQKVPSISKNIWRNHSRPTEPPPAYELIGENPPYLVVPHHVRFQLNQNDLHHGNNSNSTHSYEALSHSLNGGQSENSSDYTTVRPTTTTTSSTLPPDRDSLFPMDARGQAALNTSQPLFHHNPPYKQQLPPAQLDMASTQQIVADYDLKVNFTSRPSQKQRQPSTSTYVKETPTTRVPSVGKLSPVQQPSASYEPPFELNSPLSSQLNSLASSSHESHTSNGGNSSPSNTSTSNNNNSTHATPTRYPQQINHRLKNKLQHLIIGKILKNQGLSSNQTSQTAPTSQPNLSNIDNYHTPASLISSTVANNVASLIAHKLNSIFVKPMMNSAGTNPGSSSSTTSTSSLGLSSLFGYRLGSHPNSPSKAKRPINPFITVTHSTPVNRRTAGVGSLLVSGLIYGLSVLPALMALTGINPFDAAGSVPSSSNLVANRQAGSTVKKSVQPKLNIRRPHSSNANYHDGFAYLVPVIPTVSNVLDDEFLTDSEAHQTDLKSLYSPPATIIEPSESIHLYDSQPPQATLGEFTSEHPLDIHYQQAPASHFSTQSPINHPYARYKGHLYYAQPLAPVSTSVWSHNSDHIHPDDPLMHASNQLIWQAGPQSSIFSPIPKARRDYMIVSKSHRLPTYAKNLVLAAHEPLAKSTSSNSTNSNLLGRSYRVGYTLNYKSVLPPLTATSATTMNSLLPALHQSQQTQRTQRFIEFQDADDVTSSGMMSQWKPIPNASGRIKYNLNQATKGQLNRNSLNEIKLQPQKQQHHSSNHPNYNDK